MPGSAMPLSRFHPVVQSWFTRTVGSPTDVQRLAWPRIASGEHVLVTAPTGSGKTLAAFLWALDGLLTGRIDNGAMRILYVSPMRALNNDVRRNLLAPLAGLREAFESAGLAIPEVRVMTRSGDTPSDERQRMTRRPPEILITTPESLNILLTSKRGRASLAGIRTVILDEVHAVLDAKRGVHLITAVDRLVPLCGEFQRVALSATVRPLERVAAWVGGYRRLGDGPDTPYRQREVSIVRAASTKSYEVKVCFPSAEAEGPVAPGEEPPDIWPHVTGEILRTLDRNRSTLVFANSKRMVEKLARFVNADAPEQRVYSHHGALSREIRAVVEQRLKQGSIRGIVATNSLELGIDIGSLDEVVLVQTPPSVASALQRIGRAGHGVGEVSRGTFLPLISRDVLDAAVVAKAVIDGAIEQARPVCGALDVLAQIVVSMTAAEPWNPDDLFALLRTSDPYHHLPRKHFDLVIDMLTGRYASARVRELRPLVSHDRVTDLLRARGGSDRLVYMSGGTIPDRGYYRLRRADSMAPIGELDEEFVWERSVGDTFTLGVQSWRVVQITHNDVLVQPSKRGAAMAPFWRAESRDRSFALSDAIGRFLEDAEPRLEDPAFRSSLRTEHHLQDEAADALVGLLVRQKRATAKMLPHRHRVVLEHAVDPTSQGSRGMLVLHTFWGGRVNRPLAMALQAAWEDANGVGLEVMHDDDCVVIDTVEPIRAEELFSLVTSDSVEAHLRRRLEATGTFGARFREAAGRALLLPRAGFRHRNPLWLSRVKSKKLLAAVSKLESFPLVIEAWRECLQDAFDLPSLRMVLDEVRDGDIELATVTTAVPSPFASNVTWQQTNKLMYEDDTPEGRATSKLGTTLLRELVFAPHLRPRIPVQVAASLQRKLQRTETGWSPRSADELLDWVVERVLIPIREWSELREAVARDHGAEPDAFLDELGARIVAVDPGGGNPAFVTAAETLPRLREALAPDGWRFSHASLDGRAVEPAVVKRKAASRADGVPLADLLGEVLRFHAAVPVDDLNRLLPAPDDALAEAVDTLVSSQRVVVDNLLEGSTRAEICDGENVERMLRMVRAGARPHFEPQPVERLVPFLAERQGFATRERGVDALRTVLERLFGLPLAADLWESEVLPARIEGYQGAWLDALLAETDLTWLGSAKGRVAFMLGPDRELFVADRAPGPKDAASLDAIFPHPAGRFGFDQLVAHTRETSASLTERLWGLAFRGWVTNDGFQALRFGIETRFKGAPASPDPTQGRRARFARWRSARPSSGAWYRLPDVDPPGDALEQEEIDRDRVRVLLERWGVVFRSLIDREAPSLRWGRVFRTLRIMELSGEVVSGQFFEGVDGLQFAAPSALERLRAPDDEGRVFWMSAADPASPCGLGLEGLGALPRRVAGNHLALAGSRVVVTSESRGKRLSIRMDPGDPRLAAALGFLSNMLVRQAQTIRCVTVETVNGEAAASSPYRPLLEELFHTTRDRGAIKLMRKYDA